VEVAARAVPRDDGVRMDAPRSFEALLTAGALRSPLRLLTMSTREALSRCFRAELDVAVDKMDADDVADALLGERASVSIAGGSEGACVLHGVITRVEAHTAEGGGVDRHGVRLRMVPRLALLGRGGRQRIFQDKNVPDIVREILDAHDVPSRFALQGAYDALEYVVQYEESDLRFVERLLATEGILYAFDHERGDQGEVLVISDGASPLGDLAPNATLPWRAEAGLGGSSDAIHELRVARRVRDGASAISAFDFRRPLRVARGEAAVESGARDGRASMRRYLGTRSPARVDDGRARRHLEQDRTAARVAEGRARHVGLTPGVRFEISGGPIAAHDGAYHVTRVERAFARNGVERSKGSDDAHGAVFECRFACVPDGVVPRPEVPRRRFVQTVETAIVVGPPGQEIHVDELGRIKVRFHWDESGTEDARASCWIRTTQAMAGAGWGFQFVPRVGMEVLVAFLGGDLDAPVVVGALNNTVNPPPYALPASKTRSGIRTRSTRNATGYNELAFEDRSGYEMLVLRAERDLDTTVQRDAVARVGRNRAEHVEGAGFSVVQGNSIASVGGNRVEHVGGDASLAVNGSLREAVDGAREEHTRGSRSATVEGDRSDRVVGQRRAVVGGASETAITGDASVRTDGSFTVVVGKHDAPRAAQLHVEGFAGSFSTGPTEITATEAITLRCGDSVIRVGPDAIQIESKSVLVGAHGAWLSLGEDKAKIHADAKIVLTSDDAIALKSSGASIGLKDGAKMSGATIKLGASTDETLERETASDEITTLSLVDREGNPQPHRRYRIVLDDGTERTGALDENGRAEVRLPTGGRVYFPETVDVEER